MTLAIRSEGVGQTRQDLEGVEQSMDETAERAGESAEELEGFSERFQGAMSAAVAALAVGAAGLLSQVPVLGEAFGGLAAIVSALAFQMDGVLRPIISPLTTLFYEISQAIFNADGAMGTLIGVLTTLLTVGAVLIPMIATIGSVLGTWASVGAGVVSILGTIGGAIVTVAGLIASLPLALTAAVAAIVGFAAAYALNIGGIRDKTDNVISDVVDAFLGLGSDIMDWASNTASKIRTGGRNLIEKFIAGVKSRIGRVVSGFQGVASGIADWAGNLADRAKSFGANVIKRFIEGMKDVISDASGFLNELGGSVGIDIPTGGDLPDLGNIGGGTGGSGSGGGGGFSGPFFRGSGSTSGGTQIDGRQLTESTGRYRSDPSRRRGL